MEKDQLTQMLKVAAQGDQRAAANLYEAFYSEIKKLAVARMSSERDGHTLQPTALVNEAYMKLININQIEWQDRKHFLSIASTVMRQILVDHARGKAALKRGGDDVKMSFDEEFHFESDNSSETLKLHDCLNELQVKDERKAKIVELKFFGGFSVEEIADILEVSTPTVKRDWKMAKSWLYKELKNSGQLQ